MLCYHYYVIIMKKLNRRDSLGHHGSKRRDLNWCNTHTHMDRTHSLKHLHQDSYNHVECKAPPAQLLYTQEVFYSSLIFHVAVLLGLSTNSRLAYY